MGVPSFVDHVMQKYIDMGYGSSTLEFIHRVVGDKDFVRSMSYLEKIAVGRDKVITINYYTELLLQHMQEGELCFEEEPSQEDYSLDPETPLDFHEDARYSR